MKHEICLAGMFSQGIATDRINHVLAPCILLAFIDPLIVVDENPGDVWILGSRGERCQ